MKIQPFEQNVNIVSHNTLWDVYQSPGMFYNFTRQVHICPFHINRFKLHRKKFGCSIHELGGFPGYTYRIGIALQVKKDDELPHIYAWVLISLRSQSFCTDERVWQGSARVP